MKPMDMKACERAYTSIHDTLGDFTPRCGMILGSGWSDVAEAFETLRAIQYSDIPGLGETSIAGHAGRLLAARHAGMDTLIFQGRRHVYEGAGWTPVALPVYVLKRFKAEIAVLTNAAGGIRQDLKPGKLMMLTDHINAMGQNPLIGPHDEFWGPRFPDQTHVYDPVLAKLFVKAARECGVELTSGVYLAASGPTYETPAEIRAYRTLGADAVGMSTVPEALLASACGLKVLGLSCISNCAAGILDQPLTHDEVTAATREAMPRMKKLLLQFWKELAHDG